jgi:hypothetical protein
MEDKCGICGGIVGRKNYGKFERKRFDVQFNKIIVKTEYLCEGCMKKVWGYIYAAAMNQGIRETIVTSREINK